MESLNPAPESPYAMAKLASELMLQTVMKNNPQTYCTSLRLASTSGYSYGFDKNDIITKFVKQALKGSTIQIQGGTQEIERINVSDVISAIFALMNIEAKKWEPIYNVGSGENINIASLANIVVNITKEVRGWCESKIIVNNDNIELKTLLDIKNISTVTRWKPNYNTEETIRQMVKMLMKEEELEYECAKI